MAFTSTVPAAVALVEGYMQTVAAATAVSNVNVYVGYATPLDGMSNNFMMVGDYMEGMLIVPTDGDWASMGVGGKRRTEKYAVQGCIRTYAGDFDWQSRLNDAMSLLDALEEQFLSDPGGSNQLTGSGSWGQLSWRLEANGPLGNTAGWGVVIGFELHVINAQVLG